MNVTIEQRQRVGGGRDEYYVDCVVEFSDLERTRIHQDPDRFLTYVVLAGYDAPPESWSSPRTVKRGAVVLFFMAMLLFAIERELAMTLLAGAFGSWLYGIWFDHEGYRAADELRLGAVIDRPPLVLYAETQERAQQTAADLRERLNTLDAMLASP